MPYFAQMDGDIVCGLGVVTGSADDAGPGWVEIDAPTYELLRDKRFGGTLVAGVYTEPAPPAPRVSQVAFALLLSRATRDAIRSYRRTHVEDDDIEDLFDLLTRAGETIDLGSPLVAAGLALLAGRGLLPAEDVARILAGEPPSFSTFV